jgi:hypothetical protein
MEEFKTWFDDFNLLHLPIRGAEFTWANGRRGTNYTEKRLDRALANFKFKIISKIIADRLASILPSIISEEQRGFIHDRNIKDCLCSASEATNLLHNKSFGGNLALKIDISKAFDTLE